MTTITNSAGTEIDFEAAVNIMDDTIRERLHMEMTPCSEEEFFRAYCDAHRAAFGEEFEPNKYNPVW